MPPDPLEKRGASRHAIHPTSEMYILPNIIPPMFEDGFTPLVSRGAKLGKFQGGVADLTKGELQKNFGFLRNKNINFLEVLR